MSAFSPPWRLRASHRCARHRRHVSWLPGPPRPGVVRPGSSPDGADQIDDLGPRHAPDIRENLRCLAGRCGFGDSWNGTTHFRAQLHAAGRVTELLGAAAPRIGGWLQAAAGG